MIDILYLTFNRIAYTKITLPALIENAGAEFSLTIIDNGSTDGTVEYLKAMQKKYKGTIKKILFNSENIGLSLPTNVFWKTSKAQFVGKVDNDTLVPEGWLARLLEAHKKSDKLGVVGGFHFNLAYVDQEALKRRIFSVDGVSLIPDAFIGGCCYLLRKTVQQQHGYLAIDQTKKTTGWTEYQQAIARSGYLNGYLYPLLLVEHFDDPLSEYNLAYTKHREMSVISMGEKGISNREEQLKWYIRDAKRVEMGVSLAQLGFKVPINDSEPH
ncbi:glycosyltransferase [Maridesulfovibrio salexigens]|uniref:Glycosyl transferase family 2 n=1 Tax=Maridesulfovibrio salexigens (strain ATCC 14822 / DSM 2638 / NCIMB 8403 / VKM B-1763) TaxID=526222 RepID=C6BXU4_MARSD|nr:glycosyltransferase family 2 protein [Maridesulfovibrio salexigens]ACS78652.1 glycosyl transferase family 2 [Maridesulfovibrio salexigens DSM 2638]